MDELKKYLTDNRTFLAVLLLFSMILGVMVYGFMWMLSKDGIEERQDIERRNRLGMVWMVDTDRSDSNVIAG